MHFYEKAEPMMEHFSKSGGFLTVKSGEVVNTMTISWGFIGQLWGKPHFVVVVRPQRYTRGLIDSADNFTVSVPFSTLAEELKICGSKSGRDINKSEVVNFVKSKQVDSPVVGGCDAYYECVIRYNNDMQGDKMPPDVLRTMYNDDLHRVYVGEIVECYGKDGK